MKRCPSRTNGDKSITLHRFPVADPNLCQSWMKFCGIENLASATTRICSLHFKPDDFDTSLEKSKLREQAIPTIPICPIQISGKYISKFITMIQNKKRDTLVIFL